MKMTLVPEAAQVAASGTCDMQLPPVDDLFCFGFVAVEFDNSTTIKLIKQSNLLDS